MTDPTSPTMPPAVPSPAPARSLADIVREHARGGAAPVPAPRRVLAVTAAPRASLVSAAAAAAATRDPMLPGIRQQISTTGARLDVTRKTRAVLPSPPSQAATLAAAHAYAADLADGSGMVKHPGARHTVHKTAAGERAVVTPLGRVLPVMRGPVTP